VGHNTVEVDYKNVKTFK